MTIDCMVAGFVSINKLSGAGGGGGKMAQFPPLVNVCVCWGEGGLFPLPL